MTTHWHDDELAWCPCDENECGHDVAEGDDLECPDCGADLAAMDEEPTR